MKKSYDLDVLMSNLGKKKQKKTVKDYGKSNDYTGLKKLGIDKQAAQITKPIISGWQKQNYKDTTQDERLKNTYGPGWQKKRQIKTGNKNNML